jgi:cell division control protein 12
MTTASPMEAAPLTPSEPITSPGTGIANLPNQRHKIVAKNGANFTLMVCGKVFLFTKCEFCSILMHEQILGESGVGKTTFVNTLFTSTIKEPKNLVKRRSKAPSKTVQIQITRAGKL